MNIILFTKSRCKPTVVNLARPIYLLLFPVVFGLFCFGLFYGGYRLGSSYLDVDALAADWQQSLHSQHTDLQITKVSTEAQINALAVRLAQVQAHAIRLDALGARLTAMAKLDKDEFNFELAPAQGGPENVLEVAQPELDDLQHALETLTKQLEDREQKLHLLETTLLNRKLQDEVLPAGRPISSGWMSSGYGSRTDPFTGRRAHHSGVDFAGKMGSDIIAVGAGVVTRAGEHAGYGLMVEISHGNGYVTRYAHNLKNLVSVGDFVEKGQSIALMGSSGRSTGPHVHFEVMREGRFMDPIQYIRAAR